MTHGGASSTGFRQAIAKALHRSVPPDTVEDQRVASKVVPNRSDGSASFAAIRRKKLGRTLRRHPMDVGVATFDASLNFRQIARDNAIDRFAET
jgi:hypothetical protein